MFDPSPISNFRAMVHVLNHLIQVSLVEANSARAAVIGPHAGSFIANRDGPSKISINFPEPFKPLQFTFEELDVVAQCRNAELVMGEMLEGSTSLLQLPGDLVNLGLVHSRNVINH